MEAVVPQRVPVDRAHCLMRCAALGSSLAGMQSPQPTVHCSASSMVPDDSASNGFRYENMPQSHKAPA